MLDRYTDRAYTHRHTACSQGGDVLHPVFHSTVHLAHVPVLINTRDSVLMAKQFLCDATPCNSSTPLPIGDYLEFFLNSYLF